jgi:hypothetical protein
VECIGWPHVSLRLTVLFEDPFWVGIFEKREEAGYSVARHVFGGEPSGVEVYEFILHRYVSLEFGLPLSDVPIEDKEMSFKRRLREARRAATRTGVPSKAHEVMRLQLEHDKEERKEISRAEREMEKERQFLLKQQRRKEKHRGH